jgi:hypothetical protein
MKKNRETDWSHSDGDAPWNQNYRPTFDDYMQEYPTPGWPPKSYPGPVSRRLEEIREQFE